MINKMDFLRKIKKNRLLVLVISLIVICGVYFAVQKAIDAYIFNNNGDIVFGSESSDEGGGNDAVGKKEASNGNADDADEKNWFEKLFGGDENSPDEEGENSEGKISEEEVDLVLEDVEGLDGEGVANESNLDGEAVGSDERCKGKNICIYNWRN